MSSFRYIVGIDLGTSSCALSYVDRYAAKPEPKTLPITQWHQQGLVESETLPSFCYLPKNKEAEQFKLPFSSFSETYVVGVLAQERLASQPDLVVHSAKSWLCHGGVDREAKILPWHSDTLLGEKRLSPVYASSLYLRHLKDVWNKSIADGREEFQLEKQKIIITVPASFDETASYLTLEASKLAGLGDDVSLCEEPQAAFYYWLAKRSLAPLAGKDESILVVDIGGGTTDFCLFRSSWDLQRNDLTMQRVAVSDHILLGGDNIDLALAHLAEKKLHEQGHEKLSGEKWAQLVFECRRLKEKSLLEETNPDGRQYHLSLQMSSGSKLLGQTRTILFTHEEILQTVAEGFFPVCSKDEYPSHPDLGLKEWGLPYSQDSAISKHLAAFLKGKTVDKVLYTGGSLIPSFLRNRLTKILSQWQKTEVLVLENDAFELAVSRGASIFGFKQMNKDDQVRSGYPRSLYIKVIHAEKQTPMFLCIVPKGFQSLEKLNVSPPGLHALLGQVARFELFSSLHRAEDKPGVFVSIDETSIKPVSILQTRLGEASKKQAKTIPISLEMRLAASGLLELYCIPSDQETGTVYPLKFSLNAKMEKSTGLTHAPRETADRAMERAVELISRFYGKDKVLVKQNPMSLPAELEQVLGRARKDWDLATLRLLWAPLREGMNRRNRSEQHELAWLNLGGYVLRPGYGEEMDSLRIREVQSLFQQGPAYPAHAKIKNQWWIFWRRLAGGLDRRTQDAIFSKIYPLIKREDSSPEIILLLGALERADMQKRVSLGQWLSSDLMSSSVYREQKVWALTRLANRLPLYGGAECIMRPNFVGQWLEKLLTQDLGETKGLASFFANACRLINDRELDIPDALRLRVIQKLEASGHSELVDMVKSYVPQDSQTVSLLLGESLPVGLTIC